MPPSTAPGDTAGGCHAVLDNVPATGSACGLGRAFVAEALRCWGVPEEIVEVSVLVTSELVANAVNHAPPPGSLRLRVGDGRVRIEVGDAGEAQPRMVRPGDAVTGGRGLLLVDRLASRWGWDDRPPGKVVWCEVTLPDAAPRL